MPHLPAGRPIPAPADFPVTWTHPEQSLLFWVSDRIHFESPMGPLAEELIESIMLGFNTAAEQYDINLRLTFTRINTYLYASFNPALLPPRPVLAALTATARLAPGLAQKVINVVANGQSRGYMARLDPVAARLATYWNDELLPEVRQYIARWECADLRGSSQAQLAALFEQSREWLRRCGAIHFMISLPEMYGLSRFEELYRSLFPGASALDSMRLVQGFDNKTLENDRALWRLSRQASGVPAVRLLFETLSVAEIMPALEESAEGRSFLVELRDYLDRCGQRSSQYDAISRPSWIEDPAPALKNLKDYIGQPERDLEAERAARSAERERAIAEARAKLNGRPRAQAKQFETLLAAAQAATVIHEDHNYWLDQRMLYQVRRLVVELGRRLAAAGVLADANDVFLLTPDELGSAARGGESLWDVPVTRKAELERFRAVHPPAALGSLPLFDPPDDPFTRALFKALGALPGRTAPSGAVRGQAGSGGKVQGTARIIRSLAEAGKLQKGDVLVAEATMPPWTPLFATACAVVTDAGGILSHSAIVAREYGIPAVVGTVRATTVFHDGQRLEVDGDAGTVRVVG